MGADHQVDRITSFDSLESALRENWVFTDINLCTPSKKGDQNGVRSIS